MFDNEIMPIGEKIKNIRDMFGSSQRELAEGICSINNISLLEKNRQNITYKLAVGIAANFNIIAQKKKINVVITADELIKDEDSQANNIFKNNIVNNLNKIKSLDLFEDDLYKAEELIEKYNIIDSNKIELYKLAADFYYREHIYTKSDEMCNKALKIDIHLKNIFDEINIYIYKSRNSIMQYHYTEALEQLEYAENLNNSICNDEFFERIFFSRALIYKKLNEYDKSLIYLDILISKIKDNNMFLKVKMLHANCLNEQHKFEKSKKEYIEILDIAMKIDNKDFISMAYRNLSELDLNKRDYKSAGKHIQDCLECNPNNEYLSENLYFAAKVLQNLNKEVEQYLLRALDICEKKDRENLSLIEKVMYELLLIYIEKDDETNIMLIARKTETLNIDCCLIYSELIYYYRERKKEKSVYFNRELINKLKYIKKM